ncbi:TPA: phage tail protein, partial [Listeria monocytogenes]|nr:phage tail protein [Listeria monocytogenes]
ILKEVEESIILDSEMQNSYIDRDGFILPANNQVQNTLPTLAVGANTFEWAGNVDKIEVIPRWWTL